MRKKIVIAWLFVFLILVTVVALSIWNMHSQARNYYLHYYQDLRIEKKYHIACGECTNYISNNGYGRAKSVSVKEVLYADVQANVDLTHVTYADEDILWELTFVLEGHEGNELIMYCDPRDNVVCAVIDTRYIDSTKYQFAYELNKTTYKRGEEIVIKVTLTNISGDDLGYKGEYRDFNALSKLYFQNGSEINVMQCAPMSYEGDNTEMWDYIIGNNESRTRIYYYIIPDYAPLGEYHLELSYDDAAVLYKNVLQVVE